MVPPLSNKQTWIDAADAFQDMLGRNVDGTIQQVLDIRQLRDTFDVEILKQTCRMLGFDVTKDVLDTHTDLTKIVTQLPLYADQNGTKLFPEFIELALNGTVQVQNTFNEINPLNPTYYKKPFYPEAQGPNVVDGGNWYETTHINLSIGLLVTTEQLKSISLKPGQTLRQRTQELFYSLAPINLVVNKFYFVNTIKTKFMIGAAITTAGSMMRKTVVAEPVGKNCEGLEFFPWR